jgi:hypothetical protein
MLAPAPPPSYMGKPLAGIVLDPTHLPLLFLAVGACARAKPVMLLAEMSLLSRFTRAKQRWVDGVISIVGGRAGRIHGGHRGSGLGQAVYGATR